MKSACLTLKKRRNYSAEGHLFSPMKIAIPEIEMAILMG
jgi:hypothetical protein